MARIKTFFATTALSLLGMAGVAVAGVPGFTTPEANLRAGPGREYPFIAEIRPGEPVDIHGCVGGYGWCDVATEGLRGWIAADKLRVLYGGRRVVLEHYAPEIALPVVTFDLGDYWGQYYPQRPFYAERFRYAPELGRPGYQPPHETIIEHNTVIEHGDYARPPGAGGRDDERRDDNRPDDHVRHDQPDHAAPVHDEPGGEAEHRPAAAPQPAPAAPAPHEHEHAMTGAPAPHGDEPKHTPPTAAPPSDTDHPKHVNKNTPPGG